jgi:hypothetical protein
MNLWVKIVSAMGEASVYLRCHVVPSRGDIISFTHQGVRHTKKVYQVHVNLDNGDLTFLVEDV